MSLLENWHIGRGAPVNVQQPVVDDDVEEFGGTSKPQVIH